MFVEIKNERGYWQNVRSETIIEGWDFNRHIENDWYPGRNYHEFAILANVRNGYGFAGVDTGDVIEPLAMPRGLPDDVADAAEEKSERYGVDGHSHSWLTLKELRATDEYWNKTIKKRGIVSPEQAEEYHTTGKTPESWCGGVSPFDPQRHIRLEWEVTYGEYATYLLGTLIPRLESLKRLWYFNKDVTDEDIRIVFFFDN